MKMISGRITTRGFLFFLLFAGMSFSFTATGQSRYYWVGKGDRTSWNDIMNWSATSGGLGGAAGGITDAPKPDNTVVFNENSTLNNTGLVTTQRRVNINGAVQCDSLIVENCTSATLPVFLVNSGALLTISGSLFLQAGVSFSGGNVALKFASFRPLETIDADGVSIFAGSTHTYSFNSSTYNVSTFSGSATYKLASNADFGIITFASGMLDLNGKNLSCHRMNVLGGDITFVGSTIECRQSWNNQSNLTFTSTQTANSLIRIGIGSFNARPGDQYHNVEFYMGTTSQSDMGHEILTGTYNKITILKGESTVGGNNLTVDSLIISAAADVQFRRSSVDKHFEAKPSVCGGQIRLYGSSVATDANRTITMGAGANVTIERAVIHDLIIAGAAANAGKSYDWGNTQGFTFTTAPDAGQDLYWTGGGGYWGDPAHWSQTSDGLTPANCIPTLADNVFFNAAANTGGTAISLRNPVCLDMEAWCNNMTWNEVPGSPSFYLYGTSRYYTPNADYNSCADNLMIGGSLTLQSTLSIENYHNVPNARGGEFWFVGNDPNNTITTNGVPVSSNFVFQSATGTGGWKIMDNLTLYNSVITTAADIPANTTHHYLRPIYFNRGNLDMSNITVIARSFNDPGNTPSASLTGGFSDLLSSRALNMANATIDLREGWTCLGGQPLTTAQSFGSLIVAGNDFNPGRISTKDDDYYYNVEVRKIAGGYIGNNQSNSQSPTFFNKITLSGAGSTVVGSTETTHTGTILPDSLLFTGYGTYTIVRDMTVNEYVGTPTACGGLSTVTSASPVTVTIGTALPHAGRLKIRNTNIHNISIAPADTLYGVMDCNLSGTSNGWTNTNSPPQTFYWVGRAGNWSDSENWSLTSGLNGGHKGDGTGCTPSTIDKVIFDDGSFDAPNQRVTVNATSYCDSMYWIGSATLKPDFYFMADLNISGSVEFQSGMTIPRPSNGGMNFVTNRSQETIKTNGVLFDYQEVSLNAVNKESGWKLLDNWNFFNVRAQITFGRGTFDLNGNSLVNLYQFRGNAGSRDDRHFIMANSTIIFSNGGNIINYAYSGDLDAENSNILMETVSRTAMFNVEQDAQYHNLEIGAFESATVYEGKFNKITASENVTFGSSSSSHIETDTLILGNSSSHTYKFRSGSLLTVHEAYYGNGTPCSPIYLQSTSETVPALFDIKLAAANYDGIRGNGTKDTLLIDYAYIHGIMALTNPDNAFLYKGMHCPDVDRSGATAWAYGVATDNYNQDWARMDAYAGDGSTPFQNDRIVSCIFFPYLLSSVNFSPTPASRFKWFNCNADTLEDAFRRAQGSTREQRFDNIDFIIPPISTARDLLIYKGGVYSLLMDDGTGCVIYDDIIITMEVHEKCTLVEKCDGDLLMPADLPYMPQAYTSLEIETAAGSDIYYPIDLVNNPFQVTLADNGRKIIFYDIAENGAFAIVTLVVSPFPGAPAGSSALSFCAQASVEHIILNLVGSGIKIYANPVGGDPLDPAEKLVSGNTYYASQTIRNCESTDRLAVTANIISPCPIWEIWNWEDLSNVMSKKQNNDYVYFALMQDLGVPGQGDYGLGNDLIYSDVEVQNAHKGDKRFGWYGYEGFIGGSGNIDTTTVFSLVNVTVRDNAASGAYNGGIYIPVSYTGWDAGGWEPIGTYMPQPSPQYFEINDAFTGTFYGQGFEISGLWINREAGDYQGLFGFVANANFSNLGVNISDAGIVGNHDIGGLIGRVGHRDSLNIANCYVSGSVEGTDFVGGMIGAIEGKATISGSYSTGIVKGSGNRVGGFAGCLGALMEPADILIMSNCYAASDSVNGAGYVGGLVGVADQAVITNCYATGNVKGNENIGGLVGSAVFTNITNCYAATDTVNGSAFVGGLVGSAYNTGTISKNFAFASMVDGTDVGRVVGYKDANITLLNNTALSCMMVNSSAIAGSANDNNGADVMHSNAIGLATGTYTDQGWDFVNAWTFDYEYGNLAKNYDVTAKTNLPILMTFNKIRFPKAVQPPYAHCVQATTADKYIQVLACYDKATLDVFANDTMMHRMCGEIQNFTIVRAPATGTVDSVTADKNIAYSYPEGFTGRDTLIYEVECDNLTYKGNVFIMIVPCPDNIDSADCVIDPMPGEWGINPNFLKSSELVNSYGQPYVGDVDGCGKNEVLVWNYPSTGNLRGPSNAVLIFDDSLHLKYTIPVNGSSGNINSPPDLALAFAKTNPSNAAADIFVVVGTSATNGVLKSYYFNGTTWNEKWINTTAHVAYSAAINIGDIDNEREVVLYVDNKIFNANTGELLLTLPATPKGKHEGSAPVMNLLADMDNDGTLEAVAGTQVYKLNITNPAGTTGNSFTVLYKLPAEIFPEYNADGFTSVADMNLDGWLDVIVGTSTTTTPNHPAILVWNTQTTPPSLIAPPVNLPGSGRADSRVFIGDVDSDGYPELAAVSTDRISCYELNDTLTVFAQKWARTISDNSAQTYMCMFDFNQDNKPEIVYRDEEWLHILDGATGADKTRIACFSPTNWEGPIVADLNGDGHAQIIVTGNDREEYITSDSTQTHLRVYTSSKPGDWAPARSVWNQYSYSAVNINENLTVPQFQLHPSTRFPNGKRPYNNFLQQQTLLDADGNSFWLAPNIVWNGKPTLTLAGDTAVFDVCIENIGDAALQAPIYISFYKNDTTQVNFIALDSIRSNLLADSSLCFKLVVKNISDYAPFTSLWISVNDRENVYPYQQQCETDGRYRCVTAFTIQSTVFPFVHTGDTSFDRLFTVTAALYEDPDETVGARKLNALLKTRPLFVDTLKYYDSTVYIPGTPKNPGGFLQTNNPGLPLDWSRIGQTAGLADTATVQFRGDLPGKPIGYYSFTVPPGEYVLVLSRAGYLDRYAKITVDADSYLGHRELLPGDLDGSGNVTVADLSRIKSSQSTLFGDGLYKAEHDLDGNRSIGQPELDMVLFHMGAIYLIYPETRIWLYGE